MGVYISNNQFSILIDGLHTKYGEDYLFPDQKLVNRINTVLQPDALLFTHRHCDHFSAQLSRDFLIHNKKAILFGPNQITKNLSEFSDRLFTISTKDYVKQTIKHGDINITGLKINHVGKKHVTIENVGYIVNISNKNILHVGDTNWLEEINLFDQLKLAEQSIYIAILPYWMLLDNQASELIKKYIEPKHIVATHISPRIKKEDLQSLKNKFPEAHFLTKPQQRIQF
ncbi:hypothetical protein GCM10022259_09220 [Aquimarina mytili]